MASSSSENSQLVKNVQSGRGLKMFYLIHCYVVEVLVHREGMPLAEGHPADVLHGLIGLFLLFPLIPYDHLFPLLPNVSMMGSPEQVALPLCASSCVKHICY